MAFSPLFKKLLKPATIGGILLGVGPFGYELYKDYFKTETSIAVRIDEETEVLDVRKPVDQLNILFRGNDILAEGRSLRLFKLTIKNDGNTDILQAQYDHLLGWGLQADFGDIVDARVVYATNDYLKSNLNPRVGGERLVLFEKVIFEKGQGASIEILALSPDKQKLSFRVVGKIAGISDTPVLPYDPAEHKEGVVSEAFGGGIAVHGIRMIAYTIAFFAAIFSLVMVLVGFFRVIERLERLVREERLMRWKRQSPVRASPEVEKWIGNRYVSNGSQVLSNIEGVINSTEEVFERIKGKYDNFDPFSGGENALSPDKIVLDSISGRRETKYKIEDSSPKHRRLYENLRQAELELDLEHAKHSGGRIYSELEIFCSAVKGGVIKKVDESLCVVDRAEANDMIRRLREEENYSIVTIMSSVARTVVGS